MKNPFFVGNKIEIHTSDLIFGRRLAERNKKTLCQIDNGITDIKKLEYFEEPKQRGDNVSKEESTRIFVDLYTNIKKYGFNNESYLNIEILPFGQIRMRRGRHRLSILHHLGNRKITVEIGLCDKEFAQICEKIFVMNTKREGKLYQEIRIPLFKYIPTYGSQQRINLVTSEIDLRNLKVLDIGYRMGLNSHISALFKASVVGVDIVKNWEEIANYLTKVYEKKYDTKLDVTFVTKNIYDYIEQCNKFDIVIFFSVFHHLVTGNSERAYKLINDISKKCDVMFFDAGTQWKRNFNIEHEGKEVVKRTEFNNYKLIGYKGQLDLRRDLWMFTK